MWPINYGIYSLYRETDYPFLFYLRKIPFNDVIHNLFLLQITRNTGMHNVSKNRRPTSKFWAPEVSREAINILGISKRPIDTVKSAVAPVIRP